MTALARLTVEFDFGRARGSTTNLCSATTRVGRNSNQQTVLRIMVCSIVSVFCDFKSMKCLLEGRLSFQTIACTMAGCGHRQESFVFVAKNVLCPS
jgi:hypothetical protein